MFHRRSLHRGNHRQIHFWLIYVLSVIFVFHRAFVIFSNSSFMGQYLSPAGISALYTIGSALAVFGFLFISRVLRRTGNVRLSIALAAIEILSLFTLGFAHNPATLIVAFVVFLTVNPLIYLNIDIFSETLIGNNENGTGSKRGLALTLMSLSGAIAPALIGILVAGQTANLSRTYLAAGFIFIAFIVVILTRFKSFADPVYEQPQVLETMHSFWVEKDIRYVFLAYLMLQIFFAWTNIYIPLYMAIGIGFSWGVIGTIISIGLLAYVLFEYPIGIIADKYIGEKEMMAAGFLVLAVVVSWISFLTVASFTAWTILMFMSRFGASLVEATCESYFFKHTKGGDANVMSFFRLTRPLSMVLGSLMGSIALLYLPFQLIFLVLAAAMVLGIFFTMGLKDTRETMRKKVLSSEQVIAAYAAEQASSADYRNQWDYTERTDAPMREFSH